MSGNVAISGAQYTINYTGTNATFSLASNSIIFGSTTTNKITPATGYYLKSLSGAGSNYVNTSSSYYTGGMTTTTSVKENFGTAIITYLGP